MFRSRSIRNLLAFPRLQGQRRRQTAQQHRPVRLRLETLEERITPSGGDPTVTQTAGSYAALTALIAGDTATNTNYIINITNSFKFATGGQVTISKLAPTSTLTIETPSGSGPFTLTGNGNRLFDVVGTSQSVTLSNLTLTGGSTVASGGAILDSGGSVSLSGMTVKTNAATGTATSMARGGGVFVSGGGSLTLTDTLIANNTATGGFPGQSAAGGGVYASGASTVTITNSALSGNKATGAAGTAATAAGASGSAGGSASGGGLFVSGSGWTVTLKGTLLSSNSATGGAGGLGAAGVAHTTAAGVGGLGGAGGAGGNASGGGLFATGSGTLTVLDEIYAPMTHPSIMINNTATGGAGGAGGVGGAGGAVTGTGGAGGAGGAAGTAGGGALALRNAGGDTLTADIGNTTLYGNTATGGAGGVGGAGGIGFTVGLTGISPVGGAANGGGLNLALAGGGGVTVVNTTVGNNAANGGGTVLGNAMGGGIYEGDATSDTLDNNTITLNTATGGATTTTGGGIAIASSNPTLINNLIQGNLANALFSDLASTGTTPTPLPNANHNFITVISPGAVNPATNTILNFTPQLGGVVGVNSFGNPTGGPIYYPLAPGVYSIGAGTTSVLNTITLLEGVAPATDEVGQLRTTNGTASGSISLGAVQPLVTGAPLVTMVVPGNATVNYFGAVSPAFTITVGVNTTTDSAASGAAVSIYLNSDNHNPPTLLGSAIVGANGIATVSVPAGALPPNLQVGKYELIENFAGNASFDASSGHGTLTISADETTLVPGNASVTLGSSTPFAMSVEVNSPFGTVNSGTVTIDLVSDDTTTVLGTGTVSGGMAVVHVTNPAVLATIAALPVGKYDLEETYADVAGGQFGGSGNTGMLTVTAPVTLPASSLFPATGAITTSGGTSTIPVVVNCPGHVANGGTVTISLVNGSTTTVIGSATAFGGVANVPVTIPAGLAPGTYTLVESYSGDADCAPSSTSGRLTVSPATPPLTPAEAALEFAIDAAELVSLGNPGALGELQMFSETVLHRALTPPSQLIPEMQTLFPQAGELGLPALGVAMWLAQDLAIENPMS